MKVEVLASVMNASLRETVQHMNLQSDAVIINQCDRFGQEEMQISQENGEARIIRFYSFPDRGIGRSRNEAILRARGDICLFRMQILYMRTDMKRRSWQNLRKIRRQT